MIGRHYAFRMNLSLFLFCVISVPTAFSKGVFEFRFNKLPQGICPSSHCFVSVCLQQYQSVLSDKLFCSYGKATAHLKEESLLSIPFSYAWPDTLTMIVTVSAPPAHGRPATGNTTLLAEARRLAVGETWTEEQRFVAESSLQLSYRAVCSDSFHGADCSTVCRQRNDVYGHYTCREDGSKACLDGWNGVYCDQPICSPGCNTEHGHCTQPGTCECSLGWTGPNCDECERYPGCEHGTCDQPFQCTCNEGWGGLFCNQDLNYCTHFNPCKNSATCTNTGAGHYTCHCPAGYVGVNCENEAQNCADEPCLNNGACVDTNADNYTCNCAQGFGGRNCQIQATSCADQPCMNGGLCLNDRDHGYVCACSAGWEGANCDQRQDRCQPSPCMNGGRCISTADDYQCVCPVGFIGDRCQTDRDDCAKNPCLNGGVCHDQINSFRCSCPSGFTGSLCQAKVDQCRNQPCVNGGKCVDVGSDFKCLCPDGFKGKDCSLRPGLCASNTCLNGGLCVPDSSIFPQQQRCICPPCFQGTFCESSTSNDRCRYHLPAASTSTSGGPLSVALGIVAFLVILFVLIAAIICCLFLNRERAQNMKNRLISALQPPARPANPANNLCNVKNDLQITQLPLPPVLPNSLKPGKLVNETSRDTELGYVKRPDVNIFHGASDSSNKWRQYEESQSLSQSQCSISPKKSSADCCTLPRAESASTELKQSSHEPPLVFR